jgi:hypothetical protein
MLGLWWARLLNNVVSIFSGAAAAGDYESIATVTVGAGGAANVDFTGISTTDFTHLQIRYAVLGASGGADFCIRVGNGSIDTGSNYTLHILGGNGSSAYSNGYANETQFKTGFSQSSSTTPAVGVVDLLDYANTNKFKTMRALGGRDGNGSGDVQLASGVWRSTSAINTIRLYFGVNFNQYSHFALYGIKSA